MSTPSAIVKIDFVRVYPGETLTVYAQSDKHEPEAIQIELRVRADGQLELFCTEPLEARSFNEWYSFDGWAPMEATNG